MALCTGLRKRRTGGSGGGQQQRAAGQQQIKLSPGRPDITLIRGCEPSRRAVRVTLMVPSALELAGPSNGPQRRRRRYAYLSEFCYCCARAPDSRPVATITIAAFTATVTVATTTNLSLLHTKAPAAAAAATTASEIVIQSPAFCESVCVRSILKSISQLRPTDGHRPAGRLSRLRQVRRATTNRCCRFPPARESRLID